MAETEDLRTRVRSLIGAKPGAQREFAKGIGLDETKLSKSLKGTRRFSPEELVLIAGHAGVTVNWLLNGSDEAVTVTAVPVPATRSASAPTEGSQPERRRHILETAWKLIATRGYHHVRIADIAKACGTSTAAIHYYFPTREDVLNEALRRNVKLAFDRQVAELHAIDNAHERLVRLVELQLPTDGLLRDEWSVWLQVWNESALNPAMRSLYWDSYNRWFDTISMTVRTGQEQGLFRDGDPREVATRLSALIDGLGIQVLTGKPGRTADSMREHLRDFIDRNIVQGGLREP
ncbi:TetR family transcriptional regulator C-terminal domain-containing protein [Prauserella cavernicola]|uniref:TetR family transcriptional regulator C-terminal domain-containing protein n=1 Tax=Prauserella cavernicola TaxID=2800127 RepID=A0A934QP30_9PSEU|nr:TetR family transcriptional regulator C-terminal domain-containing protein [Prauserella cavernicola]MBK1783780.1 TetR family transcriptional regulator C-terminal domain-containing protein [Prauserella cavernicola]